MRKWTDRGDESLEPRIAGFATPHRWICNPAVPRYRYAAVVLLRPRTAEFSIKLYYTLQYYIFYPNHFTIRIVKDSIYYNK